MKNKKWIYILAAVLLVLLAIMLLVDGNEEMFYRVKHMAIAVGTGIVIILGVLLLAVWASGRYRGREAAFRKNAVAVSGRVRKIERVRMVKANSTIYDMGGYLYHLYAEYEFGGQKYTKARRSYFGEPPYKEGDPIIVHVNPNNPAQSMILPDESPVQKSL